MSHSLQFSPLRWLGQDVATLLACSTFLWAEPLCYREQLGEGAGMNAIEIFSSSELGFLASMDVHRLQIHQGIVTHSSGNRSALPRLSCPDCPYQAGAEGEGVFKHCLQHLQPSLALCPSPAFPTPSALPGRTAL